MKSLLYKLNYLNTLKQSESNHEPGWVSIELKEEVVNSICHIYKHICEDEILYQKRKWINKTEYG